jgi:hypothetical protein
VRPFAACFLLLLYFFLIPSLSYGFYEKRAGDSYLELRGFMELGAGYVKYPESSSIFIDGEDFPWKADFRLLADSDQGQALHITANVLQSTYSRLPLEPALAALVPFDIRRSSVLTWVQHDTANSHSEMVVDVLQFQYRTSKVDYTVGRQPINLATTFYFAPNDFFAPFAPQTFFRAYKPGVDALRGDLRLAELSQLTLLAVLSYETEETAPNKWEKKPDWQNTSYLGRGTAELAGFEWGVLGGTVNDYTIIGGSLQGDILGQIVLRAEGHYGDPETSSEESFYKLSVGIEKLYANNFNWRLEYFQNSNGGPGAGANLVAVAYQGRDYGALGLGFEFTPLLTGGFVALANINDNSQLFSANFLYSLSNESELSLLLSAPSGSEPSSPVDPGSEFGNQPATVLLEFRAYF